MLGGLLAYLLPQLPQHRPKGTLSHSETKSERRSGRWSLPLGSGQGAQLRSFIAKPYING